MWSKQTQHTGQRKFCSASFFFFFFSRKPQQWSYKQGLVFDKLEFPKSVAISKFFSLPLEVWTKEASRSSSYKILLECSARDSELLWIRVTRQNHLQKEKKLRQLFRSLSRSTNFGGVLMSSRRISEHDKRLWCEIYLCRFANCETNVLRCHQRHGDVTTITTNYTYMYLYHDKTTCAKAVRRFVKRNCGALKRCSSKSAWVSDARV